MAHILKLEHVTKQFTDAGGKQFIALRDISLTVHEGEFFIMVGPSGSGKSTVLRIMSGLDNPTIGTVERHPDVIPGRMGFVFQNFALMPWMTVAENVGLGLSHVSEDERSERVKAQLKNFRIEQFAHARPHDLSGGLRQRVGLARAFAIDPKVVFMDEPFSELDTFTADELRTDLLDLWEREKPTIIMVTHLVPEAVQLADRVAVFTPRPGKVEKVIVNELKRPRERRTKEAFALEDALVALIKP